MSKEFCICEVPSLTGCYDAICDNCFEEKEVCDYKETQFTGFLEEKKHSVSIRVLIEEPETVESTYPALILTAGVSGGYNTKLCKECLVAFVSEKYSEWFEEKLEASHEAASEEE